MKLLSIFRRFFPARPLVTINYVRATTREFKDRPHPAPSGDLAVKYVQVYPPLSAPISEIFPPTNQKQKGGNMKN